MKSLTPQEFLGLKTLERRLRRVFYRYSLPGTFEEFFQSYHDDYLQGKAQNQKLKYYAIDYLRRSNDDGKYRKEIFPDIKLPFDDSYDLGVMDDLSEFETRDMISKMKGKFRVIAGLAIIHNLSLTEIGFLFDVTGSRISHLVNEIINKPYSDLPFIEDTFFIGRYSKLQRIEEAARLLGIKPLWLRDQLKSYEE